MKRLFHARPRYVGVALFAAAVLATASCSGTRVTDLSVVRGKVLYKGEPATGAQVIFHPRKEQGGQTLIPTGVVEQDGSFTLVTNNKDQGAPRGDYYVFVIWTEDRAPAGKRKGRKIKAVPEDVFKGKYADHRHPRFKAQVKEGTNELPPFELQD
jgi:hypothetical protein